MAVAVGCPVYEFHTSSYLQRVLADGAAAGRRRWETSPKEVTPKKCIHTTYTAPFTADAIRSRRRVGAGYNSAGTTRSIVWVLVSLLLCPKLAPRTYLSRAPVDFLASYREFIGLQRSLSREVSYPDSAAYILG